MLKVLLWNYLDKNVLLWHREAEAPLFLRVYQNKSHLNCNRRHSEISNLSICWASGQSTHPSTHSSSILQANHPSIHQATWKHTHRYCRWPRPAKASSEISENVFEFNSLCRTKSERQRQELAFHWAVHFPYVLKRFRLSWGQYYFTAVKKYIYFDVLTNILMHV